MSRLTLALAVVALVQNACTSKKKTELPPEKETIQDIISSHVGDVSDCYTAALKKNPKLSGKLLMEWDINPIGDVKNVKVVHGLEPKLDKCMVGKVSEWAFTPPPDGKIAKVKYPFVFAPVPDVTAGVKTKTFETVAPVALPNFKKCPQIEAEYAALCVRDEDSGECVLDEKQMGEMLQLMRASPKLDNSYLAELDKKLKNPKPAPKEAEAIITHLSEDCWTTIHVRMWTSIFHTLKRVPTHSRRAETKEVLGSRNSLEVPTPTLLALSQDLGILDRAVESGFIKPSAGAKKDLAFIQSRAKALSKTLRKDWGAKPGDEGDVTPMTSTADPALIVKLVRKELKAVKQLRTQLKDWVKKYWRKL